MRRVLFSLVAVAVVFALAYGAAASLTVTSGVLQAGSDSNDSTHHFQCDTDGVNVSYNVGWNSANKRFEVTSVTVSDIDNACNGKTLAVQLTESSGALGNVGTVTISSPACTFDSTSSTFTCTVNVDDQPAEDVTDVHVAIY
jgi:membrane-bound inhibitor of C-type lysozyme